jgi:regulatory protein
MKKEFTREELQSKIEAWCAKSEHCEQEVRAKLRQWGCRNEEWENDILASLRTASFIDETRFCKAFVHDKSTFDGWGRMKIRMMLRSKHLELSMIEEALKDINPEVYQQSLERAIEKYGREEREKSIRFALQRGFEYDEILEALDK